jgi:hypothetical protein
MQESVRTRSFELVKIDAEGDLLSLATLLPRV